MSTMNDVERALIDKYGFHVTLDAQGRYIVRDPLNKNLGKKGRIEGGNLLSLLFRAERERVESVTATAAPRPPATVPAPTAPSTAPTAPMPTPRPRRPSSRDTSVMDAVYDAVINGTPPNNVHKKLVAEGVPVKSSNSTYTHAAICLRVVNRVLKNGWLRPKAHEL